MHDKMADVASSLVALGRDAARVAKLRAQIATANIQQLPPQQQPHASPAHNQAFVTVPGLLQAMGAEAVDTVQSNMARLEELGRAWHEHEASLATDTNSQQGGGGGAIDAVTFLDLALASVFKSLADLAADVEGPASGCMTAPSNAAPMPVPTPNSQRHAGPISRVASTASAVTVAPTPQVLAKPPSALRRTDSRTTATTTTTTTVVSADPPSSDASSKHRRASVQSPARNRTPQRRAEAAAYVRAPFGAADGAAAAVPPITPPTRGQSPSRTARVQRPAAVLPEPSAVKNSAAEIALAAVAVKDARELVGARDATDPAFERRRSERLLHAEHGSKRRLDILARLEQSPPEATDNRPPVPPRRHEDAHQLPSGEDSNSQCSTPTALPVDRQHYGRPRTDNVTPTDTVATTQHRPAVASHTPPTPLATVMLHKPQNPRSPAGGAGVAAMFAQHMLGIDPDDGAAVDVGGPMMPVTFPVDDSAVAVIG
jgi:hypothetical protein